MEEYNDIINLPHHISKKHPRLSMEQRAAQFAPFAALTGYEEQVKETVRRANERVEMDEVNRVKYITVEEIELLKNERNKSINRFSRNVL